MTNRNEAVVRRYFDELWSKGNIELVDELLHPDYANHSPSPGLPPGRDGVRVIVRALRHAFPDLTYTIEELVVADRSIATRTTMRGTHRGDFFGVAPTGRRFEVDQMTIERFSPDGRIVAHYRVTDEASLMRQLTG